MNVFYRLYRFAMPYGVAVLIALLAGIPAVSADGDDVMALTLRNHITELLFGLKWKGFGRYPTGVFKEDQETKVTAHPINLKLNDSHIHCRPPRLLS